MKKNEPQSLPQSVVANTQGDANGHSHNKVVVDTAAPRETPQPPTHPALSCWDINRKLEKLEKSYAHDQEKKPTEIEFSSIGNPWCVAISWRVGRLEQYVEEIKAVYEKEIESGRFADTPDLWAAVYAVKILPSVAPKINSLRWNLTQKSWLTGAGGPGEQMAVEEAQRGLSRLRTGLECELATAASHADTASVEKRDETSADDQLALAPDYSIIRFDGGSQPLTKNQSAVIKTLHEQLKLGLTQVPKNILKNAMGNGAGEVKDSFKRSPLWGTLVVSNASPKGTYSLNLSACLPRFSTDDSATAPQPRKHPAMTPHERSNPS